MIDSSSYKTLTETFPAFGRLDAKSAGIAQDSLEPDEQITAAESVSVDGRPGVLVLTNRRVVAFYTTKMLFFFTFATIQEFHLAQLKKVVCEGSGVRLRSEASDGEEDGWEEGLFVFSDAKRPERFVGLVEELAS